MILQRKEAEFPYLMSKKWKQSRGVLFSRLTMFLARNTFLFVLCIQDYNMFWVFFKPRLCTHLYTLEAGVVSTDSRLQKKDGRLKLTLDEE